LSPAYKYKKIENQFVDKLSKTIRLLFASIGSFFKFFIRKGRQRFTVMFIPHSEKKIFNFHISVFALLFLFFLIIFIILSFFGLVTHFTTADKKITSMENSLDLTETDLNKLKEEISKVGLTWKDFRYTMNELLEVLGTEEASGNFEQGQGGDYTSFFSFDSVDENSLIEINELRSLRLELEGAISPMGDLTNLLESKKEFLTDIPTLWPILGKGNLTAYFGVEQNPFSNTFRLHRGIDIAWSYNTPIVATANGKVQSIDYQPSGLGIVIKIGHKYGFATRYGHLNKPAVVKGQNVIRGQIIGYMGNTGLSTGPHLHYEVWMGTQVVDPLLFLDIKSPLVESRSN